MKPRHPVVGVNLSSSESPVSPRRSINVFDEAVFISSSGLGQQAKECSRGDLVLVNSMSEGRKRHRAVSISYLSGRTKPSDGRVKL
jgi:hypothetical protein